MTTAVEPALTITEMAVPKSLDAESAHSFIAMVDLGNAVCESDIGLKDLNETPAEVLPRWLDQTDRIERAFLAHSGGQLLGAAILSLATEAEATGAETDIMVLPQHWGHGVEDALLACIEDEARRLGRRTLQTWTLHRTTTGGRMLTPRTGWGTMPATPMSDLLTASGFTLEQAERNSAFDLTADPARIAQMLDAATAYAGGDYRLIEWLLPTPPEYRDGYAAVSARMATDAPSADLDVDEEVWDAERIVRHDAHLVDAGRMTSVVAVEHVPTEQIVAFNELVIGPDRTGVTHQYNTLVVKEHRGKRLGVIVKCANLLRWRELAPHSPKVTTFNAEENRPMLDINEAIGFVPVSYAGAWQKRLTVDSTAAG